MPDLRKPHQSDNTQPGKNAQEDGKQKQRREIGLDHVAHPGPDQSEQWGEHEYQQETSGVEFPCPGGGRRERHGIVSAFHAFMLRERWR